MNELSRIGYPAAAAFYLGLSLAPAVAQMAAPAHTSRTYECAANTHCDVYCVVDWEKQLQTGSPKEITLTELARNNYLVELTEQSGKTQFAYLSGTKVVCMLEGVAKKDR
jgi:hypothetical protein